MAAVSAYAQLSPAEKKAIAWIDGHMDAAMQLLITSVNINSGTLNVEGVKKVGALYAHELEKLGFTIEWVNEPDSLHRAGHLVATHAASLPGTQASIRFTDGLPSMEPTAGNLRLVGEVDKVSKDMGVGAVGLDDPAVRGAGDISDIAHYLDCLDGLGASGGGAHRAGETINLKQYPLLIQRAAILMYRLSR